MITISFQFLAGRYHATPGGTQVAEDQLEWPPSPWQILRTLLAVGFSRLQWPAGEPPLEALTLVARLAAVLPTYRLPVAGTAQLTTRRMSRAVEGAVLPSATFLRFGEDNTVDVAYAVDLNAAERACLESLVGALTYLGRAESRATARVSYETPAEGVFTTIPTDESARLPAASTAVPTLAPLPAGQYDQWRQVRLGEAMAGLRLPGGRKRPSGALLRQRQRVESTFPVNLIAALCRDTGENREQGWTQPPGSRVVRYARPASALASSYRDLRPQRSMAPTGIDTALLRLEPSSTTELPAMWSTLAATEQILQAMLATTEEEPAPALTGRGVAGEATVGGHGHSHYIPLDLDEDGLIDHVLLHAPRGFDETTLEIVRLRGTSWVNALPGLEVGCVALGRLEHFATTLRTATGELPPVLGRSRTWESSTPFFFPRFLKRSGSNSFEGQLRAECSMRWLPVPEIQLLSRDEMMERDFLEYDLERVSDRAGPPSDHPWCVRLVFPEPVSGPICLGYGSHFGLGNFEAVAE